MADPEPVSDGPYTVRFSSPGSEATVQCGDGQVTTFANSRSLQFTGIVTCLVKIDSGKAVVQLDRAASVTCRASGSSVSCDK